MTKNDAENSKVRFSLVDAIMGFRGYRKSDHKKLIQDLLNWDGQRKLKALERITQIRFVSALLNASMSSSPIIDRFISWLLAVIGATFILSFSNLASTTAVLPKWSIVIGIIGFLITAILGFLQKLLALNLHTSIEIGTCFEKQFKQIQKEYASLKDQLLKDEPADCIDDINQKKDSEFFEASLKSVFGEEVSKRILTTFEKAISDPVSLMQSSYKQLRQQRLYASLTVLCFSITVLGLVGGIITSFLT